MSQNPPPPPTPDAPSAAVTNNTVALALLPPPSPSSPALPHRARATNLFQDCAEKRPSDPTSTGYSPAKKKGGCHTRGAGISPRDADEFDADAYNEEDNDDEDYSPTPVYKIICTTRPKRRDTKGTLDSSYFLFLCPTTFDTKRFIRGHPQVYSMDDIVQFDTDYQKQLSFNFSAMRATRKKSASMHEARASCLRDVDLDITPTLFSRDTTDRHKLSRYVLEDLLSCTVGCWIIVCIHSGAHGNQTEESYSEQAQCIASSWNEHGLAMESWRIAGDFFHVLQGTISRSTLHDEVTSNNPSQSRFMKYFTNLSG